MNKAETYLKMHIPGAVQLDYLRIIASQRPVMGLVPDDATLATLFSGLGIDADTHVIAYDDEGGGRAARLLWTLEVAGHTRGSLLNGGLHSWANEGHPLDTTPVPPTARKHSTLIAIPGWLLTAPISGNNWARLTADSWMCAAPRNTADSKGLPSVAVIYRAR